MRKKMLRRVAGAMVASVVAAFGAAGTIEAAANQVGSVSKLPLPRYVSLKSDRVNLRQGPSKEHRTAWVFQRSGLPVEIIAEYDNWRRIRDAEGAEGWVLHSLLSGRRTALVAPWRKGETLDLKDSPEPGGAIAAKVEAGVVVRIKRCDKLHCRVTVKGYDGYLDQKLLWGVYPDEKVE